MLDQSFLIASIIVVIALLFYILYWNRLLAFILCLVLRVFLWNKDGPSVWIQINSLHISFLSGRILLKDFRYHSSNQSVKVVKVQLRWQYWVRSLTTSDHLQAHASGEDPKPGNKTRSPRCRFHATLEGFEWFLYNRTAAFDNIVAQMEAKTPVPERQAQSPAPDGAASHIRHIFSKSSAGGNFAQTRGTRACFTTPKFIHRFMRWLQNQLPELDSKDLFPLSFEGINGGIVLGNMSTSNILVAEFARADGVYGTVPSRSPLDLYKQLLNIKFTNASITLKKNEQYQAPMVNTGSHIHEQLRKAQQVLSPSLSFHYFHYLTYSVFSKLYRSARLRDGLRAAAQSFKKEASDTFSKSFRLRSKRAQSIDNETPVGPDSVKREYAIERKVLEAPTLELSYYVDAVGVVPAKQRAVENEGCDVGNGDVPPEWGLDLVVHGGVLRYGPWADRQRAELQRIFFPPTYSEAEQTRRLLPGDNRLWTAMRIFVELRGGTTLHIPFREASKNWQWDGLVNVPRPRTREAASLSIRAGDDSTINYVMPMVADAQGYHPLLEVHLDNVTVSSSLNDIRVLTTESCRMSGELPSPLKWDASRQWAFHISLRHPVFYLLRDHINISGPPSDYFTWVPMRYAVNLDLHNYVIHFYVNDHNIIDKPLLREENALLTLRGASLRNENIIMSDKFRPLWSTHRLQTMEPINKLMTFGLLHLDGSYLYFSDVREENVDQLRLNFTLNDAIFRCLAWSIRHFMIFQQNYFGTFTHFSTLGEYLQKRAEGRIGDPIDLTYRPGTSNQMQVEFQLNVHRSLIVLPVGLPGYETALVPEIEVQLRSHSFGLEMNLNCGTIYGEVESDYTERSIFTRSQWYPSSEVFVIEGVDILADRLFGPQPRASTYVCFWELNFGAVKGLLSAPQGRTLQSAIDAFTMNFKDPINAPATEFALPLDPDVTFLRISVASGLHMASNDLAGNNHRKVTSLSVPKVIVRFLHSLGKDNDWVEAGEIVFDVALDSALLQAKFLAEQDEPTGRLRKLKIGRGKRGRALPPRTLPLRHADNESMSSGDESDDMDLTDDSSCGSDISRLNEDLPSIFEEDPAAKEHILAFRYSKVSRHYGLPADKPSSWVNSPVFALRDRRPYTDPVVRPAIAPEECEHDLFKQWKAEIAEDAGSTSTIRVSSNSCEAWVTPLLPPVIIHLLEDNSRAAMSPEQRLDSFTAAHIRDLLSERDAVKDSIFDVQVSSIRVQVVQLMHTPWDQHDGFLHVLTLLITMPKRKLPWLTSNSLTWVSRDRYTKKRSIPAIVCPLHQSKHPFAHKRADLVWRALSVEMETEAADYIPEVVSAHTDSIIDAVGAYRRLNARVLSVARWSQKHSVVDPLSTIQPSYLVQTGRPREIRIHPASKILIYIRNCLRFLPAEEREAIHNLSQNEDSVTREDVIALLEGQLAGLSIEGDATSLANLGVITRIFGAVDLPRPASPHERPIQALGISLQSTKISVLHPTRGASSEVSLGSVEITAALKKSELHLASTKAPKDPSREKHRSVVQHVSVSAVLNGIEVLMLPHILNLAQSLVRLRKRPKTSPRSSLSLPTPQASQILSLNAIRLQVAAEKLIVAFNVSHLDFVSSAYIRGHSPRPELSANASLFLDSMALEAHSSSDRDFPVPQDIIPQPHHPCSASGWFFTLSVPRSAIRLWKFIEEWKADYLPGFERTIQALVSELRQGPSTPSSPTNTQLRRFFHVLPGTWLSWELFDAPAFIKLGVGVSKSRRLSSIFGLKFSSQRVSIASYSKGGRPEDAPEKGRRLKVDLPSLTITGTYENHGVHILVSAGFFSIMVKPSYWDTVLSVQQKFGNDINDLLHVIADARARNPLSQKPPPSPPQWTLQSGSFKLKASGSVWQILAAQCHGLALSLAPRALAVMKSVEFDGNRRSAFVIIDCKVEVDHRTAEKFLRIKLCKIHAILQPSSIGEIGDFVDHLHAKVLDRKDERVRELAAFKEKTERIMKAFGVNDRETPRDDVAWLKDHAVVFSVSNVGVAFPLALDSVPAFLFSVKTVEFEDKNMGHSQFVMTGFSVQFHQTGNRLLYPDMKAQVRTERSAKSLRVRVGANISGFVLDLEPSIADHVASLVDVYKRGKERVDRFTDPEPSPRMAAADEDGSPPAASSILLTNSLYDRKGSTRPTSLVESFNLPMLSVWGEYRASPAQRDSTGDQDAEPPTLMLKSTIHSSENTLRPTLLPFMTDLVNRAEHRMRKTSSSSSSASTRPAALPLPLGPNPSYDTPVAPSMQITFALRIDKSKLQLTCQPDVNVIAGVYWESGGFILNVSQSGRRISFIGNHGFLSEDCVRLDARNLAFSTSFAAADKASGLEVSSMSIVVDTEVSGGMRFSRFQDVLCFKAVWLDRIPVLGAPSVGDLEDTLSKPKTTPLLSASQAKTKFTTAVLVRIRRIELTVDLGQSISSVVMDMTDVTLRSKIEEISTELSLSIGDLTMVASGNISGRALIPDFSFSTLRRKALVLDPCDLLEGPRMLDMSLKSGSLEMTLESDYQKILHLWSEPLSVTVWDDWSQMSPHVAVLDRLLRLSFTVSGTEVVAVGSVSTIPKLVSYGSRFRANLDAQREGAARESKAFRITQSPKPDNPLSAFANAMLQTARTRLREKEDSLSYVVQQRMQFSLGSLKLVVFPRTMEDNEMASFNASDLRSDLDLIVESSDLPAKRKLHLAFSGMTTSRVGPLNHGAVPADVRTDVRRWLGALRKDTPVSTIFELPAMDMDMESEEASGILEYDFVSQFARGDMSAARREDIFITLNMALYSWLTLLRKNLAREMNQAQAQGSVDRRPALGLVMATPSGTSTPRRRRTMTESSPPDIASLSVTNLTVDRPISPRPARAPAYSDAGRDRRHKSTFSMSAMPSVNARTARRSPNAHTLPRYNDATLECLVYQARHRRIERLHMRQLGEATPDVMHPFFTKKAGFSLEDSLPQYVHEYATMPIEEITRALLRLYSRQLSHPAPQ
ncbi:hypothetical protein EI94DRAFT_1770350 [Lactarius quietus]|nr:hypothetical protein EI94DRAFT_1770350 [Lactarius quietus]